MKLLLDLIYALSSNVTPLRKRPASTSELPRPRVKSSEGLSAMTDVEFWNCFDEEVLSAFAYMSETLTNDATLASSATARRSWRSDVYLSF